MCKSKRTDKAIKLIIRSCVKAAVPRLDLSLWNAATLASVTGIVSVEQSKATVIQT